MEIAYSVKNIPIRLTYERWYHIIENHDDLASYFHEVLDTVENPEFIMQGNQGTLKAAKNMGKRNGWLSFIKSWREKTGLSSLHIFFPVNRKET